MAGLRDLIMLFHEAAEGYPGKTKALAGDLDKRPSTLYDELNPAQEKTGQGKLGVDDALEIMRLTGDIRPLEFMASILGYTLRPRTPNPPDGDNMHHECLQAYTALDALCTAATAETGTTPAQLTRRLASVHKEAEDIVNRWTANRRARGRSAKEKRR